MAADDFSNDKKASWASEVEDDDEATGWDEPLQFTESSVSMPVYPEGPSKPRKNKKKKKNKSNGSAVLAKQNSMGNAQLEGDLKNLSVGPSPRPGPLTHAAPEDFNGWQVASSRKAKQVSSTSNPPSPAIHNSPFHPPSAQSLPQARSGRNAPPHRFENAGSSGVQRCGYIGTTSTSSVNGHVEGPGFGGAYGGISQLKGPDVTPQSSRSFPDGSKCTFAPQNVFQVERTKTKPFTNGTQTQAQTQGAWGRNPAVTAVKEGKKGQETNENILAQLLPSERSKVEFPKPASFNTSSQPGSRMNTRVSYPGPELVEVPLRADSDSALSDADFDDDSDWIRSDPCDSDASVKSLATRKRNKWFQSFFDTLDDLSNEQIMEHDRQWHCPACYGGVGAIEWYRGLQPLLAHAKTHRTKRIGLHREFANVLEDDLEVRRAGTGSLAETKFGKWKGLRNIDATKDVMIVWPPMVVIQNTQLDHDEQDKWIGMGNKELLDMFKEYSPSKARHSYGPQGHRGMSLVIFAESPTGYYHAERLARAFKEDGKGREQWDRPSKIIFHPGGDRILYGYMATAEDMDIFNKHSSGKAKLKWELKKYNEAVAEPLTQMDKDNQQLNYYKFKVQKQKEHSKILEKSMSMFTRKLELREEEISVIRQRATEQHEENQREMDDLEKSYKDRIVQMRKNITKREREIQEKQEEFQQEHIERCQQLEKKLGEEEQPKQAKVEEAIARQTEIVELSLRESEDYEYNKRELLKRQHNRKIEFMRKQYEEALEFEKGLEKEKQELLDRYSKQVENTS
ncbi:hypothetical protein GOP47_0030299 [Adiantum capillus-veneris]|nr:hypothetical protein GOP47_0030299 [Adiantum capillus-veneris]